MSTGLGKVVVNRVMSLDGFIAGPGGTMRLDEGRWLFEFVSPELTAEIAAETGAMLVGRRTFDVGSEMATEDPGREEYPGGAIFLLTHRPPDPDPGIPVLSGDIGDAIETALAAANGKNLELLGADVAGQALARGLVDEILVYVAPVLLGEGVPFSSGAYAQVDLEPISSRQSGDVTLLRFRVRN